MPTLRDLNRRIVSVGKVQQITKAMQLVAATKVRRAQQRVESARPYTEKLIAVLQELAGRQPEYPHPFLVRPEAQAEARSALILVTADRGMVGALNTNTLRRAGRWIREQPSRPATLAIGRRGRDFLRRTRQDMLAEVSMLGDRPSLQDVRPIVQVAMEEYLSGEVASVDLLYSKFVSTTRQVPTVVRLLPVEIPASAPPQNGEVPPLYLWEPGPEAVLDALLPRYVEGVVYQAVLENLASEYAAKMLAMGAATENAEQLIGALTLTRNKVRQATITRELMDIVSGAEALSAR